MYLFWLRSLFILCYKFNDGTHIKLINNPNSLDKVAYEPSHNCEGFYRDKFNVKSHGTPGVKKVNLECKSGKGKIKYF